MNANDLNSLGTVALRKLAREIGLKGMSSARGADLREAISAEYAKAEAIVAAEKAKAAKPKAPAAKRLTKSELEKAGWENAHSDEGHDQEEIRAGLDTSDCWICNPQLDKTKRSGRSRAGMVIIAKGTEFHKSATFKTAAEAKGWTVELTVTVETVEEDGEEFEIEKHTAVAAKPVAAGDDFDIITMVWNGKAYDYPASSATLKGKARKVRNLKEALRLI